MIRTKSLLFLSAALAASAPAQGQVVGVGSITSIESCAYFENREGASATYLDPWFAAFASTWRSWWVKDCVDEFATLRHSVDAALASSGKFSVGPGGYTVDLSLSNLNEGGPAPDTHPVGEDGYAVSQSWASIGLDVTVRDRSRKVIFGAPFVKKVETGYDIRGGGSRSWGQSTGPAMMAKMQQEIALAVARLVSFNIVPLRVTGTDGADIELNYGAPIVSIGDLINVEAGLRGSRYSIVSVSKGRAVAEPYGDSPVGAVQIGASANFVEKDSGEANARRTRRVPLP